MGMAVAVAEVDVYACVFAIIVSFFDLSQSLPFSVGLVFVIESGS